MVQIMVIDPLFITCTSFSWIRVRNKRDVDKASVLRLLNATVRLKIAAITTKSPPSRGKFDVTKPKTANSYFKKLAHSHSSAGGTRSWPEMKNIYTSPSKKHISFKGSNRQEWISDVTWDLNIQIKSEKSAENSSKTLSAIAFSRLLSNQLNHEGRRSVSDKRNYVNNIANQLQAAAETHLTGDMYKQDGFSRKPLNECMCKN